jgi:hypothetical protein
MHISSLTSVLFTIASTGIGLQKELKMTIMTIGMIAGDGQSSSIVDETYCQFAKQRLWLNPSADTMQTDVRNTQLSKEKHAHLLFASTYAAFVFETGSESGLTISCHNGFLPPFARRFRKQTPSR